MQTPMQQYPTWPYTPNPPSSDAFTLFPQPPPQTLSQFLFDSTPLKSFDGDWRGDSSPADDTFDREENNAYLPPSDWLAYSSEFPSSPSSQQDHVSGMNGLDAWNGDGSQHHDSTESSSSASEEDLQFPASSEWNQQPMAPAIVQQTRTSQVRLPPITQQTRAVQRAVIPAKTTAPTRQLLQPIGAKPAHAPVAQRACVQCRRLKASCSDERPCTRCVKFCRECTDRSEEEVAAAKARRKRRSVQHDQGSKPRTNKKRTIQKAAKQQPLQAITPPSSSHSSPISSIPRAPVTLAAIVSTEDTEQLSIQLWSRCLLTALQEVDMRSLLLSLHTQLDALPLQLSTFVHWHSQVTMLLMHVADMMTPDDFSLFLTQSFTSAQLDAPFFQNSPLAPWIRISTRPMHYAIQPTNFTSEERELRFLNVGEPIRSISPSSVISRGATVGSESVSPIGMNDMDLGLGFPTSTSTSSSSASGSACSPRNRPTHPAHRPLPIDAPQLKVEWLPASNLAYQRWQAWLANKLIYDRQVRANRTAFSQAAIGLGLDTTPGGVFAPEVPNSTDPHSFSLATTLDRAELRVQLSEALRAAPLQVPDPDGTVDDLAAGLSCLDIGKSLSAPPAIEGPHDAVTNIHAAWCPAGMECDAWRTEPIEEARKKTRLEGMDSVHHQPSGIGSPSAHSRASSTGSGAFGDSARSSKDSIASTPTCLCELSTPLPSRILVNRAFERETGFRQSDVERGFAREGQRWLRHIYPASSWPVFLREQVSHWKTMLEFMGLMSIHAATAAFRLATGDSTPMAPLPTPPPATEDFEPNLYTQLQTRTKEIKQVSTRKCVHVQHTDGRTEGSAYIIVWEMYNGKGSLPTAATARVPQ